MCEILWHSLIRANSDTKVTGSGSQKDERPLRELRNQWPNSGGEARAGGRGGVPIVDSYGVVVAIEAVDECLDGGLVQVAQVGGGLPRLLPQHHRLGIDQPAGPSLFVSVYCSQYGRSL